MDVEGFEPDAGQRPSTLSRPRQGASPPMGARQINKEHEPGITSTIQNIENKMKKHLSCLFLQHS